MGYDMTTMGERAAYFRLNIWGMQRFRAAMETAGMLAWGAAPPDWPDIEAFGVPQIKTEYAGQTYLDYDNESEAYGRYEEAKDVVLRWHDTGVIAGHKFYSNDGWVVTPEEITAALASYDSYRKGDGTLDRLLDDEDDREYWEEWIAYLQLAADDGGFEVF